MDKWDGRFIDLAKHIASWSKDPSTQTGAVIVDQDKRVVSAGYNGFPRGVSDSPERYADRDLKYKLIVHCERNAMLFARQSLFDCTLYTWPFMSCSACAAMVIQSGITRCVAPQIPEHLKERWGEDLELAASMFKEAGVQLDLIESCQHVYGDTKFTGDADGHLCDKCHKKSVVYIECSKCGHRVHL